MKLAPKLLRLLEKSGGTLIKMRTLRNELLAPIDGAKGKERHGKDRKSRGRQSAAPRSAAEISQELEAALAELVELGGVHLASGGVIARSPLLFRGKASLSPRGLVFVLVRGASATAREIFVSPQDAHGALPGDDVLVRLTDRTRDRFEGVVVEILQRARSYYRMRLLGPPRNGVAPGTVLDAPGQITAAVDVRRLPADTSARLKADQVLIVRLSGETVRFQGAFFHEAIFERFESDSDLDLDFARVLLKYDLDVNYPTAIPLPDVSKEPGPDNVKDWDDRKDLRGLYTITIDGADSKDFDDALSLERLRNGRYRLYVHIADVSHYVKRRTPLDDEAMYRATSYYLTNRVVPMLPPALSENICSLIANQNRLAFTAEMEIHPKTGKIEKSRFYKSVIRVDRRLTYDIAEQEIDAELAGKVPAGKSGAGGVPADRTGAGEKSLLGQLWDLAQVQRAKRLASGRIDFDMPEVKIKIGADDRVQGIEYRERLKSSMLIEECMLSANIAVAAFLRSKKINTLYRVHDPMDETRLVALNAFFGQYNIPFKLRDSGHKSLQKALALVKNHIGGEQTARIFNMMLLRSFMQAQYRAEPRGHWGLGFADYCHFTSPIRRYPDLVVHRALENALAKKKQAYTADEVEELGFHTSEQERKAMEAERDMSRLKTLRYIEQQGLKKFRGHITGFKPDRIFVELTDTPIEAVVEAKFLTHERELPLPDRFSVYLKKLGRPALLGEEWRLELDRLDFEEMKLYCRPIFD